MRLEWHTHVQTKSEYPPICAWQIQANVAKTIQNSPLNGWWKSEIQEICCYGENGRVILKIWSGWSKQKPISSKEIYLSKSHSVLSSQGYKCFLAHLRLLEGRGFPAHFQSLQNAHNVAKLGKMVIGAEEFDKDDGEPLASQLPFHRQFIHKCYR